MEMMKFTAVFLTIAAGLLVAAGSFAVVPSDRIQEAQDRVQDIRKQNQLRLDKMRQDRTAQRAERETMRQEFRSAVQERLDANQQTIALRVAENLNNANHNITAAYMRHLAAMSNLISRIEERINAAEERGADVAAAQSSLTNASAAAEEAKGAVDVQAAKEYVVEISDAQTIGQALRATVQQLRADHQVVREVIRAARESIRPVLQALRDAVASLTDESPAPALTPSPAI